MGNILVFVETKGDAIKNSSFELLSKANKISKETSSSLHAFIAHGSNDAWTAKLGEYGVGKVYYSSSAGKDYNPETYTNALEAVAKKSGATLVLATSSSVTKDFMPKFSARMDAGMISECTSLDVVGGKITTRRPMYSGKCTATAMIDSSSMQIITCRPNIFENANPNEGVKPETENVDVASSSKVSLKEVIAAKSNKPDLTEAAVVISAGRSIKTAENFSIMNELADVLDAAVGASRAAVDAGFAPHSMQIGQTGKTVNPKLYISFGISGAIQHLAGMRTSKVIVAVNSDPEAPIFQKCDYGIVGDMFEIAPLMTAEFKKLLASS
jgi:electron transfer flavoprotein alpha subunit